MATRILASNEQAKDGRSKPKKFHVDRDWFYQRYSIEKVPSRILAEEIGCGNDHLSFIADRLGIPRRGKLKRSVPHPRLALDVDEIVRLYVEEEMSCANIGKIFGCTHRAIKIRLEENGITLRHHNDTKRGKPAKNKIFIDPKTVVSLYAKRYESGKTIADRFGVSRQVIDRILKEQGVSTKSPAESKDFRKERHPLWRHDLTPEERENRRDISKQKEWREKIYARDNFTCQKCHDSSGGNLNAHHITPHSRDKSLAWDIDNGITFCVDCHTRFHRQYGYTKCDDNDLREFLMEEAIA